jgi:capsular polysaccharide biosynthesis protein
MEETISLKELYETLRKRIWLIISITVLATLISGIISYFVITPIYSASTQLLVNQEKTDQPIYNSTEIQTNLQLINTYNVIMKSPAILDLVKRDLDLNMSVDQLNSKIIVASETESQVVSVTVQDPDPYVAKDIANAVATTFQSKIADIMKVDNVSILAKAEVKANQAPIKPNKLLNIAIALVVGLMVGVGIAFLLEYLDNTLKTEQDIEKLLELPVLGSISIMDSEKKPLKKAKQLNKVRGKNIGTEI